jgi:hypothetical protein
MPLSFKSSVSSYFPTDISYGLDMPKPSHNLNLWLKYAYNSSPDKQGLSLDLYRCSDTNVVCLFVASVSAK